MTFCQANVRFTILTLFHKEYGNNKYVDTDKVTGGNFRYIPVITSTLQEGKTRLDVKCVHLEGG